MFEKSEDPARQKYLKAQENIDALYSKMSQLSSFSYLDIESLESWEDIEKNMSRLQMVLTSLQETKEQLLSVNLQVHRFTTEYGSDDNYRDCSLKEDITELYRQWEDTYEQNGSFMTELETLKSDWETYDEKFHDLRLRLKEAELDSIDDICDTISITSVEKEPIGLRKDLDELTMYAISLKNRLKGGDAWRKIEDELKDLKRRIDRQFAIKQRSASPSENHRSPSSPVEDDADDHFQDAVQQMCEDNRNRSTTALSLPQKKGVAAPPPKRRAGRFWRIIRVAVPVQLALVLLYCIACYLEPGCCNQLNNFNFSLTPQLRYFGGRPPV